MDHQQKKDKTERVRGLGRKTREEIGKGYYITALRFQTEVSHHSSEIPDRGVGIGYPWSHFRAPWREYTTYFLMAAKNVRCSD